MSNIFYENIHYNPIIAAVKHLDMLDSAMESPCKIIFLLTGNIFNLESMIEIAKEGQKGIFVHLDLMEGFSNDIVSLQYIHEKFNPDGIITTKGNLVKHAKGMGMFTIQRLFLLDSMSLETGKKSISHTRPDAVEILPGIIPKITKDIHREIKIPIIVGGLIMDKEDVISSLNAGAVGISTSNKSIWYM